MHARLGLFNFKPEQRDLLEKVAENAIPMMSQAPGCVSINMILDEENLRAGTITVWESKKAHDDYHATVFPGVLAKLAEMGINPPFVQEFPLYTPKG